MGRSADATLIYGVRFSKYDLCKDEDGREFSDAVLETFGEIDEFYSTKVEEILEEHFGLKLFAYDDDEIQHYALYSGDRTDAEWGCTPVEGFATGDGKFKEVLEALGLEDMEPRWLLIARYG